jgi:hypothetical protein
MSKQFKMHNSPARVEIFLLLLQHCMEQLHIQKTHSPGEFIAIPTTTYQNLHYNKNFKHYFLKKKDDPSSWQYTSPANSKTRYFETQTKNFFIFTASIFNRHRTTVPSLNS